MFDFSIEQLVPKFILADSEGYALAKAIEAGLQYMVECAGTAIGIVQDVDKMPEWRLDEMAWELNSLYDYSASIEQKRHWISDAVPLYAAFGTKAAIYNYLMGVFEGVRIEEAADYNGEPFHFRVLVSGGLDTDAYNWAVKAIDATKNVRSILDGLYAGGTVNIIVHTDGEIIGYTPKIYPGNLTYCGTVPQ